MAPVEVLASFPGSLDFESKDMEVAGLVEEYKGRSQIVIALTVEAKVIAAFLAERSGLAHVAAPDRRNSCS